VHARTDVRAGGQVDPGRAAGAKHRAVAAGHGLDEVAGRRVEQVEILAVDTVELRDGE
jgi:hypothetical protein